MKIINQLLKDWGFLNVNDCVNSIFGHIKTSTLGIGTMLGLTVATFEKIVGMDIAMYFAFLGLLGLELRTGILASKKKGEPYQSKKSGRFIFKGFVYTFILGIVNIFYVKLGNSKMGFIYETIYWSILHLIVIQLLVSVFENLSKMGFAESSIVFKKINKILAKYLNLDVDFDKDDKLKK